MALITISGQPGCRTEEVVRITAQRLGWELITQTKLRRLIQDEFGESSVIPERAYPFLVSIHHFAISQRSSYWLRQHQVPTVSLRATSLLCYGLASLPRSRGAQGR